ncbi:MAG: prolipoprotein diacylglyceryl transferase family protein [Bacteroidota bacterium]
MEFPVYIGWGDWQVHPHVLFELMAFFVGFRYFLFLRKKQEDPISTPNRVIILLAAALGALIGSRVLGVMENWPLFLEGGGEQGWLYFITQKTILGGLLGGLWSVEIAKYFLKEQTSSGDLFVYPLILGMFIGRIGCFLSGLEDGTHGIPTTLPWGMDLGDGISRHPAALYEMIFLLLLWICLRLWDKTGPRANGRRFQLFMIAYLAFRLGVDFLKPVYTFSFGLQSIQVACLAGLVYYGWAWRNIPSK